MQSVVADAPLVAPGFNQGDLVYIRPEFVDHINPIIGDGDIVNYQPWEITEIYNERLWGGGTVLLSCDLRQDNMRLSKVWLAHLVPTAERRQSRLGAILDGDKD